MPFTIPMVWKGGKDHITDCYFCMINLKGINCKYKHHVQYLDVPSAIKPICHDSDLPVPEPDGNKEYHSDSKQWYDCCSWGWCIQAGRGQLASTKQNSMTWNETWTFQRSLLSCRVHISKRNICWHQEQYSISIKTMREN